VYIELRHETLEVHAIGEPRWNWRVVSGRHATFGKESGWTWLRWPQPGEEVERVMGIEPT
jgi:hypothetical protein